MYNFWEKKQKKEGMINSNQEPENIIEHGTS